MRTRTAVVFLDDDAMGPSTGVTNGWIRGDAVKTSD
jgi:hypothetical protein